MRKTGLSLFLLLILVGSLFPLIPIYAEEPTESWDNRYSYTVDYGNGTHKSTFSIGPQVFWDSEAESWGELKFQDLGNGYLLENAMITAYVYDWYTVFYDPDNQRVSVDDERWIVEVYNEKKESWREVDLYAPSISYLNNETHLTVTRSFDCAEGEFNVTYILWQGSKLKHDISFRSGMEGSQQFRVIMTLTGIYSDKVKHSAGEETITSEKHIISPFFVFGEDNNNLVFSEYLWKLGETNETTGEWTPTTLKDVVLDTSAQGSKMDIIIGNYTLVENEGLLIDPDSDTFTVGASSDDCLGTLHTPYFSLDTTSQAAGDYSSSNYDIEGGMRWTVNIPQGSTISSAYLKIVAKTQYGDIPETVIEGEDADDAVTFVNDANYKARVRTDASVNWTPSGWTAGVTYTSGDISSVIQEIVDRGGFGTHIVLFWSHALGWGGNQERIDGASWDHASYDPPKLEVTWGEAGGVEYYGYPSQSLSWDGSVSREWSLKRGFSQTLALVSNGERILEAVRMASQTLTASISVGRTWDLSRTASQTITFTSNALSDLLSLIQRTASIDLSLVLDSARTWDMSRTVSQTITFTSNALGGLFEFFLRTANLTLNFASNALGSLRMWLLSLIVTDMDEIPLWNATVSIMSQNPGLVYLGKTFENGSIVPQYLSPGEYDIEASILNYFVEGLEVSLASNVSLRMLLEGSNIETNPEVLGLFGLAIVMQMAYFFLLYTDRNPVLTFIIGPLTSVTWYTTGQTVLFLNQVHGVPIAYLLYLFSTLNIIPIFGIVYSILAPKEQ